MTQAPPRRRIQSELRVRRVEALLQESDEARARAGTGVSPGPSPPSDSVEAGDAILDLPGAASISWRPGAHLEVAERYGRFEILGRVGKGGMAEVLLARERSGTGAVRYLAIKRVLRAAAEDADMVDMFLDEAHLVMGLSHPNLCQIYEVGRHGKSWFIAMEWVHGVTLSQVLKRAHVLGHGDDLAIARIAAGAAEALHHAHGARDDEGRPLNLVHRDVSPHNIMVAYDGRVKLLDFGIAKADNCNHHTRVGVVKGKFCYMAPEQWLGHRLDARTDVFSLGVCLYEALTGKVLFKRSNQAGIMRAILEYQVSDIRDLRPDLDPDLASIVHRAIARLPEDRYQSAGECFEALEGYLNVRGGASSMKVSAHVRSLFPRELQIGPEISQATPYPSVPVLPEVDLAQDFEAAAPIDGDPGRSTLDQVLPLAERQPSHTRDLPPGSRDGVCTGDADGPQPGTIGVPSGHVPVASRSSEAAAVLGDLISDFVRLPVFGHTTWVAAISVLVGLSLGTWWLSPPGDGGLPTTDTAADSVVADVSGVPDADTNRGRVTGKAGAGQPTSDVPGATAAPVGSGASGSEPTSGGEQSAQHGAKPAGASVGAGSSVRTEDWSLDLDQTSPVRTESPLGTGTLAGIPPQGAPGRSDTRSPAVPARRSYLSVNTLPWSQVYLGTRLLGTTPLDRVAVPAGPLRIRLVDRDGRVHQRRVAASKQRTRRVFFDFDRHRR